MSYILCCDKQASASSSGAVTAELLEYSLLAVDGRAAIGGAQAAATTSQSKPNEQAANQSSDSHFNKVLDVLLAFSETSNVSIPFNYSTMNY